MKKKSKVGAKSQFFAQKYQFFSKIDLFSRKICSPEGQLLASAPPGYAHGSLISSHEQTCIIFIPKRQ